jgi:hypothetical protein
MPADVQWLSRCRVFVIWDVEGLPVRSRDNADQPLPTFVEAADLLVPLDREWFQQIVELERGWLPAFENGFDDGGRQQGEAQDAAEVGFVDGLGFGEIAERGVPAGFQHRAPTMSANNGFDDRVVDPGRRGVSAISHETVE